MSHRLASPRRAYRRRPIVAMCALVALTALLTLGIGTGRTEPVDPEAGLPASTEGSPTGFVLSHDQDEDEDDQGHSHDHENGHGNGHGHGHDQGHGHNHGDQDDDEDEDEDEDEDQETTSTTDETTTPTETVPTTDTSVTSTPTSASTSSVTITIRPPGVPGNPRPGTPQTPSRPETGAEVPSVAAPSVAAGDDARSPAGTGAGSAPAGSPHTTGERSAHADLAESTTEDPSDTGAVAAGGDSGPPSGPALVSSSPAPTLTGVRDFLVGVAPGGLLLLGAVALLGSGSFLDALRSMRS